MQRSPSTPRRTGKKIIPKAPIQKKSWPRFFVAAVLALFLVGCGGIFGYSLTLRGKIFPGVVVGHAQIGGMAKEDARSVLASELSAYETRGVTIRIGDGALSPKLSDLGVTLDAEATLEKAYAVGRPNRFAELFAIPAFAGTTDPVLVVHIDTQKLTAYLTDVEKRFSVAASEPTLRLVNRVATVQPGYPGKSVVVSNIIDQLEGRLASLAPIDVSASVQTTKPSVSEADLLAEKAVMEQMIADPITLTYGKKKYSVQPDDLANWLVYHVSGAGQSNGSGFVIDATSAKPFFQKIADDVYVAPQKTIAFVSEQTGEYAFKNAEGRQLDIPTTENKLIETLQKPSPKTMEIAMQTVGPILEYHDVQAPIAKGKVISVDVSLQTAFAFEDGKLIFWTRASTGKGDSTPTGKWRVYAKTAKQSMIGPGYNLPNVQWVSAYNGDYTLHGTYWHTNFGHPMSHGCTNLSNADAKWFYDWDSVGTPVVIYKSAK